jgi:NAD(P)-dependent dehydrogenase (short-subunit alcohol dehydrogenase family)
MELKDKIIVVTGAGRGIGRALCQRFAAESPAAIVAVDIDRDHATQVADQVEGLARACDVASEPDVRQLIDELLDRFGHIDLFCANAGVACLGGPEVPNDVWRRVMDVNFMAHVYSARALLPSMLARGEGYLLHTASAAGLLNAIGSAPYAVSKHAAIAFAEWLAVSYGDQGIKVSCLCPQGVWTDMIDSDEPVVKLLHAGALPAEVVAEAVVEGLAHEQFLILPHPEVAKFIQNKANDYDRWLDGMRKLLRQL